MLADKDVQAAARQAKLEITAPSTGTTLAGVVQEVFATPPDIVQRLANLK